jgi:Trk K+ transport system NAD-binding subunit
MKFLLRKFFHKLRAGWRDTWLLLAEFRSPLLGFVVLLSLSGVLYHELSSTTDYATHDLLEAIYLMLMLIFLQGFGEFPHVWFLQAFFFVMPFLGMAILAQGLTDFGIMLFNRRARGKEWEMAVASTYRNHVVLIGLGHLGYRVVMKLREMDQEVVVIEVSPKTDLVNVVRKLGVPVIPDDGTRDEVLEAAGVPWAHTILLCTQNDSLNLQMALKARNLNPKIEVVIRIFEDDFAQALQQQFGFKALSATGMAAPIFAASAADLDITPPLSIGGQPNSLARLSVEEGSMLRGKTLKQIERDYNLSVVMLRDDVHPSGDLIVHSGDGLVILGSPECIHRLVHDNHVRL